MVGSSLYRQYTVDPPATREATIDLATREGVALVQGRWRYSDTKIVEVDFTGPDGDDRRARDFHAVHALRPAGVLRAGAPWLRRRADAQESVPVIAEAAP
jgi:hypothetical protein